MTLRATKALLALTCSAAVMSLIAPSTALADSNSIVLPPQPSVKADSAILIDASNGQVLYSKNSDARRAPASTTKLMTMLLVEEAVKSGRMSWNTVVPVTPDAYQVATEPGVSDAYLDPKEKFTLDDMMKFIGVISANDATVAVADDIGGDKQNFASMMNAEAQKLGLHNSHFMNPDGLPNPQHYSSARDLSTIARTLVTEYPNIITYTDMQQVTVRKGNTWGNTDKLLGQYSGLDGLKTGYTSAAGYCFVGTAERNGQRLITVVMGDPSESDRFTDTKVLLDYGFNDFQHTSVAAGGKALAKTLYVSNASNQQLAIEPKSALTVDLMKGESGKTVITEKAGLKAPIAKGQTVGEIDYVVNGKTVASTPLVAVADDHKANWFIRLMRSIGSFFSHLLHRL